MLPNSIYKFIVYYLGVTQDQSLSSVGQGNNAKQSNTIYWTCNYCTLLFLFSPIFQFIGLL